MDMHNKTEWIRCPVCGNTTRVQIQEDTELKNFPLCFQKGIATERCTYASDRYLHMAARYSIIKTEAIC